MATVLGGVLTAPSPLAQIGDYDRRKSVHGSVELELHRPLPTAATIESTITVEGIFDKRSGALVVLRVDARDESGAVFTIHNGIFVRGEGGFGGGAGPRWPGGDTPEGAPDAVTHMATRVEQPLLYRLNGDRNPLHSDPTVAVAAGFERPIMHGLCTLGFVGRALVRTPAVVTRAEWRGSAPGFRLRWCRARRSKPGSGPVRTTSSSPRSSTTARCSRPGISPSAEELLPGHIDVLVEKPLNHLVAQLRDDHFATRSHGHLLRREEEHTARQFVA